MMTDIIYLNRFATLLDLDIIMKGILEILFSVVGDVKNGIESPVPFLKDTVYS